MTVWANQWEPNNTSQHAADIYKLRFGDNFEHFNEDIAKVISEKFGSIPNHDILCGGFPCQDYSVAKSLSKSDGIHGRKGVLWWSIYAILEKKFRDEARGKGKAPRYLVLENVDRLLKSPKKRKGRDFAVMLASLNLLGYFVEWRVVDASKYGYPQRRKRVFIVAYHPHSKAMRSLPRKLNYERVIENDGLLAQAFPAKSIGKLQGGALYADSHPARGKALHFISSHFNRDGSMPQFSNAGVAYKGAYWTRQVHPVEGKKQMLLRDVLVPEATIAEEFYVPDKQLAKWKEAKGAKNILKKSRLTGVEYWYKEGAIPFPDAISDPARTIVTGEGGKSVSRFKHIISRRGNYRRLTPIELERLNGFPDNHTKNGITDSRRAFLMGNALVVGCVSRIGFVVAKAEGWDPVVQEPNVTVRRFLSRRLRKR